MPRGLRLAPALALLLTVGCGARTTLSLGDEDAAVLTPPDAGPELPVDAGRDAGRPDAGPATVACRRDGDCDRDVCRARPGFTPADLAPVPLVCGSPTPGAPVGAPCVDRGECDRGLCVVAGVCVMPCASDGDCSAGEACRDVLVTTSSSAMQALRACTALVAAPESVRVAGPMPGPRVLGGFDRVVTDELPELAPNALVTWTAGAGAVPFLFEIRTRSAPVRTVFDVFDENPDAPDWGVGATTVSDVVTLSFPNGPNSPDSPMGFSVDLASQSPSDTERLIAQRVEDGTVFDVDAYLVGGGRWVSPDGTAPVPLERAFDGVRDVLAPHGLSLGELRVHSVVGMTRRRFEMLDGAAGPLGVPEDLDDLYRLSAGANRPSVHVFFVRSIDGALGIASGIPGPHVSPGTGASGVAIAVDFIPDDELPGVIAHEIGHFMGLFHTSELEGAVNDPLTDTPECRLDRDADGDGFLLPEECEGAGADYLMFWAGTGRQISDQQAALMRRAYFVR